MTWIRRLALLLLCALTRCTHGGVAGNDGQPCNLGFLGSLKLAPSAAHLALEASINAQPTRLWLDTGGFSSVLTRDAVKQFGLEAAGFGGIAGIGGKRPLAIYRARAFRVGMIEGTSFPLGIAPLRFPPGITGWVGMDFFSRTDLDIDLPGQRLNLYQPIHDCSHPSAYLDGPLYDVPLVGAQPGRAYAADSRVSQPRIDITIGGIPLIATLDTGAPQNVLFGNGAAKLGLARGYLAADPRVTTAGIGPDAYQVPLHTMPPIQIGDLELHGLRASVIDQAMPNSDIILGLDFFRRVHVWISHSSGRLIMQFPPSPSPLANMAEAGTPPGPAP